MSAGLFSTAAVSDSGVLFYGGALKLILTELFNCKNTQTVQASFERDNIFFKHIIICTQYGKNSIAASPKHVRKLRTCFKT